MFVMIFSEPVFLFFFLPIVLAFHMFFSYFKYKKTHLFALTLFSLTFYAWWNVNHLGLLLLSTFLSYIFALKLEKNKSLTILIISIIFNLSFLVYYKYAHFLLPDYFHTLILPLAISFFTFQQIAYLVDTYRGRAAERDFLSYLFFISFFPQLVAGPIIHHEEIRKQISTKAYPFIDFKKMRWGMILFILGLSKKLVGDSLSPIVERVFGLATMQQLDNPIAAWIGIIAFHFQIYFDFSGYSDMARGLGWLMGIEIPINFNAPYKAKNLVDFWRKWHITLSRFLRDYVYIPLGGNRKGAIRHFLALIFTMTIGGFWHGANWTFVIWGFLHGLLLFLTHLYQQYSIRTHFVFRFFPSWGGVLLTNVVVLLLWVLFRTDSFLTAKNYYLALFNFKNSNFIIQDLASEIYANHPFVSVFYKGVQEFIKAKMLLFTIIVFSIFAAVSAAGPTSYALAETNKEKMSHLSIACYMIISILSLIYLILNMKQHQFNPPFVYFQF